ncbi:MAG: YlxR family protein [Eubacteriales bacterium]|nr:YlxR family protein [Eubacteriales bacterium]
MPAKPRKIPLRMCVGCREMKPKKELLRAVRAPDGEVSLDATGKKAGRGAYVCYNVDCLKKALKQRQLDRALDAKLDETANLQLTETMQRLLADRDREGSSGEGQD